VSRGVTSGRALGLALTFGLFACQAQAEKAPQAEPPAPKPVAVQSAPAPAAAAAPAVSVEGSPAPAAAAPAAPAPAPAAAAPTATVRTVSSAHEASPQAGSGKGDVKPAAPPAANERQAKRGTPASDEPFTAWLEGDVPLSAGQPATLRVVLQAKPPYHCNAEYPHKFTLAPATGVTYPTPVAKGMQVTPAEGVLPVPVVAGPAGQATVKGNLAFSVCTDERCLVEKRELALDVDIR
jgi:hypothetical protein